MRIRFKLPRARRLHLASEFQAVRAAGRSWTGKYLVLATLAEAGPSRIGIITTKRIGSAAVRSKLRRKIREVFRLNQHRIRGGFWLVTIVRASSVEASSLELHREWLRLAERASILAPIPNDSDTQDIVEAL